MASDDSAAQAATAPRPDGAGRDATRSAPPGSAPPRSAPPRPAPPRSAVVLCTYQGAPFLDAQLASIADQTAPPDLILASDDGSDDGTRDALAAFADRWSGRMILRDGPRRGYAANFLSALACVPAGTAMTALSDQDDVWHPAKLARAAARLADAGARPALYGAATRVCDADLRPVGLSRIARVPLGFRHALAQNFAGGNTMALNAAGLAAAQAGLARADAVPVHDWLLYQLVSGAGGVVMFDDRACLDYRQHGANQIGDAAGLRALASRMVRMTRGAWRVWIDANLDALEAAGDVLTPEARAILARVRDARRGGPAARLGLLRDPGLYRQGRLGQAGLAAALLLGRF